MALSDAIPLSFQWALLSAISNEHNNNHRQQIVTQQDGAEQDNVGGGALRERHRIGAEAAKTRLTLYNISFTNSDARTVRGLWQKSIYYLF